MFYDELSRHGTRRAVCSAGDAGLTYEELARASDDVARQLGGGRQVVAIEASNDVATVVAYLGALRGGHVAYLVSADLREDLREELYRRFQITSVLGSPGEAAMRPTVTARPGEPPQTAPELALLLSTSGSTGSPKLVRLGYRQLQANAAAIVEYLGLGEVERPLTALPLHYSYGLSILNSHLLVGACPVLTAAPVTSRGFWAQLQESRATSLSGVPATWAILHQLRFTRMALPSLGYATQAGGRLHPDLVQHFATWAQAEQKRFFVMYGQTEATARMAYVPSDRLLEKVGSIGRPIPGGSMTLIDEAQAVVERPGITGEIVYRGANVMLGYAESAQDLARGDDNGGVLRTGDLAYRDAEGFYFLVGRARRFAKLFGNRINLDEVEAMLYQRGIHGAVTQLDDILMVAVQDADPSMVRQVLSTELQVHHSAIRVARLDALPRSSAGKILYPDVGRMVEALTRGGREGGMTG